jgi:hypothetical protein
MTGPEVALLQARLAAHGLPPATNEEIRVYSPLDFAHRIDPALRDRLLEEMCELAMSDGLPDASEARMIYAYAAEWGYHLEEAQAKLFEYEFRKTSFARAFWLHLRNKLLPGRWDQAKL